MPGTARALSRARYAIPVPTTIATADASSGWMNASTMTPQTNIALDWIAHGSGLSAVSSAVTSVDARAMSCPAPMRSWNENDIHWKCS